MQHRSTCRLPAARVEAILEPLGLLPRVRMCSIPTYPTAANMCWGGIHRTFLLPGLQVSNCWPQAPCIWASTSRLYRGSFTPCAFVLVGSLVWCILFRFCMALAEVSKGMHALRLRHLQLTREASEVATQRQEADAYRESVSRYVYFSLCACLAALRSYGGQGARGAPSRSSCSVARGGWLAGNES